MGTVIYDHMVKHSREREREREGGGGDRKKMTVRIPYFVLLEMQGTERLYQLRSLCFSSSLLSTICGVLESRNGTLVDGVFSGVPLGHLALLLELGELAAVVDGGEQLPDEQQG